MNESKIAGNENSMNIGIFQQKVERLQREKTKRAIISQQKSILVSNTLLRTANTQKVFIIPDYNQWK